MLECAICLDLRYAWMCDMLGQCCCSGRYDLVKTIFVLDILADFRRDCTECSCKRVDLLSVESFGMPFMLLRQGLGNRIFALLAAIMGLRKLVWLHDVTGYFASAKEIWGLGPSLSFFKGFSGRILCKRKRNLVART